MRFLTLFVVCITGLLGAGVSAVELPDFDPILDAAGRPIRWEEGADGRLRFHPAPKGNQDGLPFLVVPSDGGNQTPLDTLVGGGPQAMFGLLLSGGQDFASLGDAATHAKRLGWGMSEAALVTRISDAATSPLDRLLAFRLLEIQYPAAATALRPVLAKERDLHLCHAAAPGPVPGLDDLAQVVPASAIVRIVYRPALYPAQRGGIATGRYFGVLGVLRIVDRDRQRPIDVDLLSFMAYGTDAAGELPIACAARFGNVRIDRVVAWMTPGKDEALWEAQVRGAGGAAAGKALDTWLGPSRPVSEGRRWQTDSWWSEVLGEDLMRWGIRVGGPSAPAGARPKWDQPNPRSALCISAGAAALADAVRILGICWADQDGKRFYPPVPPTVADLLRGDQTASIDVWFDGKDTLWEVRALGVDESRVLALRDWMENWLPTMPQAARLLAPQADGHLAKVEHRGTDIVLIYRTPGAPMRDGYRDPATVVNKVVPDWRELLGRVIARVKMQ